MNKEEARKLDIEVEMTVFGSQWFQVRLVNPGNPERAFEWTRLLAPVVVSRYPSGEWSIQPISDADGMALFLAGPFASTRQMAIWDGPHYSTDIAAACDMEEEIQRRGLVAEYGSCLIGLVPRGDMATNAFAMAHASPELRCRAALAAVRAAQP